MKYKDLGDVPKPEDFKVPDGEQVGPEMCSYLRELGYWHGRRYGRVEGEFRGESVGWWQAIVVATIIQLCVTAAVCYFK